MFLAVSLRPSIYSTLIFRCFAFGLFYSLLKDHSLQPYRSVKWSHWTFKMQRSARGSRRPCMAWFSRRTSIEETMEECMRNLFTTVHSKVSRRSIEQRSDVSSSLREGSLARRMVYVWTRFDQCEQRTTVVHRLAGPNEIHSSAQYHCHFRVSQHWFLRNEYSSAKLHG